MDYSKLVQQMSQSPEALEIMRRTKQRKDLAESGAKGEAMRRGFINPTGTSDIEFAMRSAATRPIEEAGMGAYANLIGRGVEAERGRQYGTSERLGRQAYGTSEREAGQAYGTSEREAAQRYGTSERLGRQAYGTGEREASQLYQGVMQGYIDPASKTWGGAQWTPYKSGLDQKTYYGAAGQAERGREHEYGMGLLRPTGQKKKKWYEDAVGPAAQGAATAATYAMLASDARLKENISDTKVTLDDIDKLKVKDYNFIGKEGLEHGLIAQELKDVFPEAVVKDGEYYKVNYGMLIPVMIKAIQDLRKEARRA